MPRRLQAASRLLPSTPHFFHQRIVHSDGSTFTLKATTPKALLVLTKDTRNHTLWNPHLTVVDDSAGELSKFQKRFGDFSEFDDLLDVSGMETAQASASPKKPASTKSKKK